MLFVDFRKPLRFPASIVNWLLLHLAVFTNQRLLAALKEEGATDGKMSRTPASHGQWGGYETERARAWVIEVGWPFGQSAWCARCGDKSFGPTSFVVAKQAAAALVTGAALPEDEHGRSFTGEIDLNVPPPGRDDWIDWPAEEGTPPVAPALERVEP